MSKQKKLADYKEEIEQCVKCGACQAHCPVFTEDRKESVVARGKVTLAQALPGQRIEATSEVMSCTAPIKMLPNRIQRNTGIQPNTAATIGPIIGAAPAMEAK